MDPFHSAEWLLAAELAALLSEAARWDWSVSHQTAARLSREIADEIYAEGDIAQHPELFEQLQDVIGFSDSEWFEFGDSKHGVRSWVSPDGRHPLDQIEWWRIEAKQLLYRLYRVVHPAGGLGAP